MQAARDRDWERKGLDFTSCRDLEKEQTNLPEEALRIRCADLKTLGKKLSNEFDE